MLASEKLRLRGVTEADNLKGILEQQRERVQELEKHKDGFQQLTLDFGDEE